MLMSPVRGVGLAKRRLSNLKNKLNCYPIGTTGFLELLADRKIEYEVRPSDNMPTGKESWERVANALGMYVYFQYVKGSSLPFYIGMGRKDRAFACMFAGVPNRSRAWWEYVEAHGGTGNIETAIVQEFPFSAEGREEAYYMECEWKMLFNAVVPEDQRVYGMEEDGWVLQQQFTP